MIRDVHRGLLFVAHAPSARDLKQLYKFNIVAVMDVAANEQPAQLARELIYCRFPVLDGTGNAPSVLKLAVETMVSLVNADIPTVVACSAGMSRSPAIAAYSIARITGKSPDACLLELVETGPHDVSPTLWAAMSKACEA
jgi:protein-tyrosine phosphatase